MSDCDEKYNDNLKECVVCDILISKYKYNRHLKTKTHILNQLEATGLELTKDLINKLFQYYCEKHNYYTNDTDCWNKHMNGNLHLMTNDEHKKFVRNQTKNTIDKGDELEKYFVNLYKEC